MDEDVRKQGILYLQQQRFGKKWKRVWSALYRDSPCSISRLEFFDCKDGGVEKSLRKQQEQKKVIRLSDCIRVSEVEVDGCPRDTGPFLVETTEKIYVFAAERHQVDDWTHKLCEIAFPMSWTEHGGKRGSVQRGTRVEEDEGMEDNSLYSGRQTVQDFKVCVRRTEASDHCRLKGDGVLRADVNALHLLNKTGDILFTWPYRFLRRFGRDKSTFSFEAGRRCASGEGSFQFDTKQGNFLFQVVEAAIDLRRTAPSHRQISGGGQLSPEAPHNLNLPPPPPQSRTLLLPPQSRSHIPQPPAAQAEDAVYSTVTEHLHMTHHKESSSPSLQKQRLQLCHLEPPFDKVLTGVKSLSLDTRGLPVPRKNQVKMISSCPLPHAEPSPTPTPGSTPSHDSCQSPKLNSNPEQAYAQITQPAPRERGSKKERREGGGSLAPPCIRPQINPEPEYSLPFDTIAKNIMVDILGSHQALVSESGPDPLYDSIDEMKIRNIFTSKDDAHQPTQRKVDHIYDEPEGCAVASTSTTRGQESTIPAAVYDDPEEMRGDAWRNMGTADDPKGHEYPYDPRVDDYAVPKRPKRAFPVTQDPNKDKEEDEEEVKQEEEEQRDSQYTNIMVKM